MNNAPIQIAGGSGKTTTTSAAVTGTFATSSQRLAILVVGSHPTGGGRVPTISGWTDLEADIYDPSVTGETLSVFYKLADANTTYTIDFAGETQHTVLWQAFEFPDLDISLGIVSALTNLTLNVAGSPGLTGTATLLPFRTGASSGFAFCSVNLTAVTVTVSGGYNEAAAEDSEAANSPIIQTAWTGFENKVPTFTFSVNSLWGVIAFELLYKITYPVSRKHKEAEDGYFIKTWFDVDLDIRGWFDEDLITGSTTNTYVLSAGGSVVFSGNSALLRTRLQPATGTVNFSGNVSARRERLQTVAGTITFSGTVPALRTRLQTAAGTVVFNGSAPISFNREYTLTAAGTITFSGNVPAIRTRLQTATGTVNFNGAVPQLRTKIFSVAGSVIFSGTGNYAKERSIPSAGTITFNGSINLLRTRTQVASGSVDFSGVAADRNYTRVQVPTGDVVFSGGAVGGMIFIPAGAPAFSQPRLPMVGAGFA